MIIPVNERRYADAFASVYNSANTLFPPERRCDADGTVFSGSCRRIRISFM